MDKNKELEDRLLSTLRLILGIKPNDKIELKFKEDEPLPLQVNHYQDHIYKTKDEKNTEHIPCDKNCKDCFVLYDEQCKTKDKLETKKKVQVIDVGGLYNQLVYNAMLHICEYELFYDCEVYDDEDWLTSDNVDTIVLITNVWGKMFESSVEEYSKYLQKGVQIFVLKPEFIELVRINSVSELKDYAMTPAQAETLI